MDSEKAAVWRERISVQENSGLSVSGWCRANGTTERQFRYWNRRLDASKASGISRKTQGWVRLRVEPETVRVQSSLTLRIGGAELELKPGFDGELLRSVVHALVKP